MSTRRIRFGTVLAGLAAGGVILLSGCAPASTTSASPAASDGPDAVDTVDAAFTTDGSDPAGDGTRCTAVQRWTALADVAPQVRDYLTAHPDAAAELDRLRSLPRDQRRSEGRDYLAAHPELRDTAAQIRTRYRQSCPAG